MQDWSFEDWKQRFPDSYHKPIDGKFRGPDGKELAEPPGTEFIYKEEPGLVRFGLRRPDGSGKLIQGRPPDRYEVLRKWHREEISGSQKRLGLETKANRAIYFVFTHFEKLRKLLFAPRSSDIFFGGKPGLNSFLDLTEQQQRDVVSEIKSIKSRLEDFLGVAQVVFELPIVEEIKTEEIVGAGPGFVLSHVTKELVSPDPQAREKIERLKPKRRESAFDKAFQQVKQAHPEFTEKDIAHELAANKRFSRKRLRSNRLVAILPRVYAANKKLSDR
jgi:hypothetical protein